MRDDAGAGGDRTPADVDPLEITAPIPVIAAHSGPAVAPSGGGTSGAALVLGHQEGGDVVPPPRDADSARRRRGLLAAAGATAAALALVGGLGYVVAGRSEAAGPATPPGTSASGDLTSPAAAIDPLGTATTGAAPLPASAPTLVLGDSLGLVVYPWLADDLPDRYVSYAAEVGRSTPRTADALAALGEVPPVVIVSTGTNDASAADFTAGANRILAALGTQRCVVWVDVVRPDRVGDPQAQMNAALDTVVSGHANVRVLRWSQLVAAHPEWMAGDGIHPNQAGAQARATAFAEASASCSPIDAAAPRAPRQSLPDSIFWGPISGSNRTGSGGSGSGGGSGQATSPGAAPTPSSSRSTSSGSPSSSRTPTSPSSGPTSSSDPAPTSTTPTADPSTSAPTATGTGSATP